MGILSVLLNSTVLMWILVFVFVVSSVRCLIYGVAGGGSALLRILATLLFAGLAYACWQHAHSVHGSNIIDRFVFDSWRDIKHIWFAVRQKIF